MSHICTGCLLGFGVIFLVRVWPGSQPHVDCAWSNLGARENIDVGLIEVVEADFQEFRNAR